MTNKLTEEIKRRGIPAFYAQRKSLDPIVYLEIRLALSPWRWYVAECEIRHEVHDILFFGYVRRFEHEWSCFSLLELEERRGFLIVNYDFKPVPFSELKKERDL